MSEVEEIVQPSATSESKQIAENDDQSITSLPSGEVSDADELRGVLPANNNQKCLEKVLESSKELDTKETVSANEINESLSEKVETEVTFLESQVKEEAEVDSSSNTKSSSNVIESSKKAPLISSFIKEESTKEDGEPSEHPKLIPNPTTPAIEISTKDEQTLLHNPPSEPPSEPPSKAPVEGSPKDAAETQFSAENVTYTDDGIAIYTDPETQYKYKWCESKNKWISLEDAANPTPSNPYENEHYRWCTEQNKWIPKTAEPASSQTETEHYRWDAEKNEWIPKDPVSLDTKTYGFEDGLRTYTDTDGAVFFWDEEKKAWFPKIDDDFMARYQMSYGFIDNTIVSPTDEEATRADEAKVVENEQKADAALKGVKRKVPPDPPKWFELDEKQNTKVYVSNLPLDITMEEFSEIMSKYGMIMKDPQTQKQKLKLYTEADGQIKGDGLCDYIKVESVDLALKLLDESMVRENKIKVQRAKFEMRGEYNPTLKPKRKKKDKEKLLKMKEKLFDWRPEKMRGERSKHEKIVIIKNLFTPELFDNEVQLIIEYQNDLREECSKCGTVRKVVIFDRHAEGVAQINMADPDQADLVVQMMNGRFFGKRKLVAEIWDGKTKYKTAETEKEVQERINKWDKYLEEKEEKEEKEKASLIALVTIEPKSDLTMEITESVISP